MLSMTGYGKGEYKEGGIELTAEVKSVNNRYLDVIIKSPRVFSSCDETIRSLVREKITRGHVEVYVNLTDGREKEKNMSVDLSLAKAYVEAANAVGRAFPGIKDDLTVTSVLKYPDVLTEKKDDGADELLLSALKSAVKEALINLNAMRLTEGEKLKNDMLSRVDEIERLVGVISLRAPDVVNDYREKLRVRMEEYLKEIPINEEKILNEVAVFTDKCNIDEEITRLKSHISQFREISKEALVGRRLDFLIQEFNREANTICSKSNDIAITQAGLSLKNEIEKVREQAQNIE